MSIAITDIKFYKAATNNDTASNGGVISANEVSDNTLNNLFPNVSASERTAGVTRFRKLFIRNENTENLAFQNAYLWVGVRSSGEDYFVLKLGTDTDTQSDATGYVDWAGAGTLNTTLASGETSVIVDFDETLVGVYSGENVKIHIDDTTNEEDHQVVGTPSWVGVTATIAFSGEATTNYSTANTIVSTMVDLGTLQPTSSGWTETTSAGTYDETTYPLTLVVGNLFNIGTVTDSWTLEFSDSTNFTVTGASTGSIGAGDIATDFQPSNGSSSYCKIDKDGWGGTWADGDTITWDTIHAGKGVWVKEEVPAAIGSLSNNTVRLDWKGESG